MNILKKMKGETIFCLFLIILFSFILSQSIAIPHTKGGSHDVGADFFPITISGLALILSGVVFIRNIIEDFKREKKRRREKSIISAGIFILVLLVLISYVYLLTLLGFVISTALFLFVLNIILNRFKTNSFMNMKMMFLSALGFILGSWAIYLIFTIIFEVYLPTL